MDLNSLLSKYPGVRLATPADNEAILAFYDRTALTGQTLKLRSVRSPDFFRFLRYQSSSYAVFIHEKEPGKISGVGTMAHRPGYVNGVERTVSYLGDFRVDFDRSTLKLWRQVYSEVIAAMDQPMITAVIDENTRAQNAFVRQGKAGFIYDVLTPYRMVNVFNRFPWARLAGTRSNARIRHANASDLGAIETFLDAQARKKAFGYCYGSGELQRRLTAWDGLRIESFLIAEQDGRIVGCMAPWSPSKAKVNRIEMLPWYFQLYRPLMNVPRMGSELNAVYLTHLEVDVELESRQEVFRALFDQLYSEIRGENWNMISFCDYPSSDFKSALKGYFIQTIPMKLFSVRHSARNPDIDVTTKREPGFEIALV